MRFFYLLVCLFTFNLAIAQSKIIGDLMNEFETQTEVDCIISMDQQLDLLGTTEGLTKVQKGNVVFESLKAFAEKDQRDVINYLESNDISHQPYFIFNGIAAKLTKAQVASLISRADIGFISHDQDVMLNAHQSDLLDQRMDAEWGIQKINADSVWMLGYEGAGVVVAGQDTGYDFDNEIILDKYRGYEDGLISHDYNWHDAIFEINPLHGDSIAMESLNPCGFLSPEPCDDHSHGTHTMGTMVGRDSTNLIGVAPQAKWIGCRNMERGYGKPSTYTECFEWFLAPTDLAGENPDPSQAPHVINNSWGCPEMEGCNPNNWHIMETVVNNLTAAGIFVVVSAGNDGSNSCGSIRNVAPIFENSFTIGATNLVDTIAGFSSIGPVSIDSSGRLKPDVVAPGVSVRSITLNGFGTWSGTSMAGPHVAGAVALMINANPELAGEVELIKDILKNTAVPLYGEIMCDSLSSDVVPNFVYGHGRIDVYQAVQEALNFSSTQMDESYKKKVEVFPNPTDGHFGMAVYVDNKIKHVQIFNAQGKQVFNKLFDHKVVNLDISDLPNGMYFYRAALSEGTATGQISKH